MEYAFHVTLPLALLNRSGKSMALIFATRMRATWRAYRCRVDAFRRVAV